MSDLLPLSFEQQDLWSVEQVQQSRDASAAPYNQVFLVRIDGRLDARRLVAALNQFIARHEAWRSGFQLGSEAAVAAVSASLPPLSPTVEDVRDQPPAEQEALFREIARVHGRTPFDLSRAPLVRVRLFQTADERHVLHMAAHHLISDAWSEGVFVRELCALYGAEVSGEPHRLEPNPLQFGDFAGWQRSHEAVAAMSAHLEFWRNNLSQLPTLELPTDHPRPPIRTGRGARLSFDWPEGLGQRLEELARSWRVTPFVMLLSVFEILLARLCRCSETVVGTPVANRRTEELQDAVGLFVNMVTLRTRIDPDMTFSELLRATRTVVDAAMAHQDAPFGEVVRQLNPARDLSRTPLFQIWFQVDFEEDVACAAGVTMRLEGGLDTGTAKTDLTLLINRSGGHFDYSTDLFAERTVASMVSILVCLLREVVEDPDRSICEYELLSDVDCAALLEHGRGTAHASPSRLVLEEFAAHVASHPDAPAVIDYFGSELSYRDLDRRANGLAAMLRSLGVSDERRVGICLRRSADLVVSILAVMKAGGAWVPLDPDYPAERIAYMMHNSGAGVAITEGELAHLCAGADSTLLVNREIRAADAPPSGSSSDSARLAYVIYTSGSTGRPKGVMISHGNLAANLAAMDPVLRSKGPGDSFLAVTSMSFDPSIVELVWPLMRGLRIVVGPDPLRALVGGDDETLSLAELWERERPTIFQCTPPVASLLLEDDRFKRCLSTLRTLLVGGQAFPTALAEDLRAVTRARLVNVYGPTETTIWATSHEVVSAERDIPVGKPIADSDVYLLDDNLAPVPWGVAGTLFLGGPGVARGYCGKPALTAERFVPNPFCREGGERLYDTGDIARYRHDGALEYLGRSDNQVKIDGHRIELGEVENVLCEHPAVTQGVVNPWRSEDGSQQVLVGYFVPVSARDCPGDRDLRAHLLAKLPSYMVPTAFMELADVPLTPSRKVDRRALPAPALSRRQPAVGFAEPQGEIEEGLAKVWSEVLGVERISRHDDFYALGGDSIRAIRSVLRVEAVLNRSVSLLQMVQFPTIAELAAVIEWDEPTGVETVISSHYEPSWCLGAHCLHHWAEGSMDPCWNFVAHYQIRGELDLDAWRWSVRELVERHDSLRSRLLRSGGVVRFMVGRPYEAELEILDLSGVEREQQLRRIEASHLAFKERPFPWGQTERCRFVCADFGRGQTAIVACFDHLVTDLVSQGLLYRELWELYAARVNGREPELSPPVQVAEISTAVRTLSQSAEDQGRAYLREIEAHAAATRPLRLVKAAEEVASAHLPLAPELTAALRRYARDHKTTVFSIVLAATSTYRWLREGGDRSCVIATASGRNDARSERAVGNLVRTLPIFVDQLGPGRRLAEVLVDTLSAMDRCWQHMSADIEGTMLAADRWGLMSEYEVNYEHDLGKPLLPEDLPLDLECRMPDRSLTPYYWTLFVEDGGDDLALYLEGRKRYMPGRYAERSLRDFLLVLETLVAFPDRTLGELQPMANFPATSALHAPLTGDELGQ